MYGAETATVLKAAVGTIKTDSIFSNEVGAIGSVAKGATGSGLKYVVGPAGRAAEVGGVTPGGLTLSPEAAMRLAGRIEGKLNLTGLDTVVSGPDVPKFMNAANPGTRRLFNPSITQFGGEGLNVVINPATNTVITIFPSSSSFLGNITRFTEMLP